MARRITAALVSVAISRENWKKLAHLLGMAMPSKSSANGEFP